MPLGSVLKLKLHVWNWISFLEHLAMFGVNGLAMCLLHDELVSFDSNKYPSMDNRVRMAKPWRTSGMPLPMPMPSSSSSSRRTASLWNFQQPRQHQLGNEKKNVEQYHHHFSGRATNHSCIGVIYLATVLSFFANAIFMGPFYSFSCYWCTCSTTYSSFFFSCYNSCVCCAKLKTS